MPHDADPLPADLFLPLTDGDGRRRGLIARDVADAFASIAPPPTQAALDAVLARATRVRVFGPRTDGRLRIFDVPRVDTADREAIARLLAAARIDTGRAGFHMMAPPSLIWEITAAEGLLATIGLVSHRVLRWDAWDGDVGLSEPAALYAWLAGQGATDLRDAYDADLAGTAG